MSKHLPIPDELSWEETVVYFLREIERNTRPPTYNIGSVPRRRPLQEKPEEEELP